MRYDLKRIMTRAWAIFRKAGITFAEALHRAWLSAKAEPVNAARIEAAKAEAGVTEEVKTWSECCLWQAVVMIMLMAKSILVAENDNYRAGRISQYYRIKLAV